MKIRLLHASTVNSTRPSRIANSFGWVEKVTKSFRDIQASNNYHYYDNFGFFIFLFFGGGNDFISFDWLCFQTLRERKNLKRVNELNNAKYQYYQMIFVSVLAIVRLNWIRGAVRTSATIEWNIHKEKPVSKIWNTSTETSYFTGADTLQPYKSCDAVCTQHLKSCDVYITILSIPNSATSLNYMILLYKTIIFNWNFPWRV